MPDQRAILLAGEIVMSKYSMLTLREKRKSLGVSQGEIARIMGVSPTTITDYENNRRKSMGVVRLRRIVHALLAIPDSDNK